MTQEHSEKAMSLPDIPKSKSLVDLTLEEKVDKILSLFDSIEQVGKYTVVKLKNDVVLCTEKDFALIAGESMTLKTVNGGLYLN